MASVVLPHNFMPRQYQTPIFVNVLGDGEAAPLRKKHLVMMSRRSGKTLSLMHIMATQMVLEPNAYLILLPEAVQARRVLWSGKTEEGIDMLDAVFPPEIVAAKNATNMTIKLINGSMLTIGGADNINSLMGGQYKGVILDEAALMRHNVYGYLKPILESNGGWIILSSTPRYGSWFNELYDIESAKPEISLWDTHRVDIYRTRQFTMHQIEVIKQDYIDRYGYDDGVALFGTEYEVLTNVQQQGSYYGGILRDSCPLADFAYDPRKPVYASYDLGQNDSCVITFFQIKWGWDLRPDQITVLNAVQGRGKTVKQYYDDDVAKQPWFVDKHILPHDGAQVRGYTASDSAEESLRGCGADVIVVPRTTSVIDDINAVRTILPIVRFNRDAEQLRRHLVKYSKDYDAKNKLWLARPKHDESSNWADSFRCGMLSLDMLAPSVLSADDNPITPDSWLS